MRVFVVKKAALIRIAAALTVIVAVIVGAKLMSKAAPVSAAVERRPIECVETERNEVALTFDTVFGEDRTQELLDILKRENSKATFAVMGAWAQEYPDAVKRMLDEGHEIISHSMMHPQYTDISGPEVQKDARAARELLKTEYAVETDIIRVPYGAYNDEVLAVLENSGFKPVNWSIDSKDWKERDAEAVTDNVLSEIKKGSIVMFQNNRQVTADALSGIISAIKDSGFSCVTLSELMNGAG